MSICISLTVYHGYGCTNKYISNPSTINDDVVHLSDLPPIHWSICKQFTVGACVAGTLVDDFSFLFHNDYYYDKPEEECVYQFNTIPNHADGEKDLWSLQNFKVETMVKKIDVWNETTDSWQTIYTPSVLAEEQDDNLFRWPNIYISIGSKIT